MNYKEWDNDRLVALYTVRVVEADRYKYKLTEEYEKMESFIEELEKEILRRMKD
jgi:hypothetical protein